MLGDPMRKDVSGVRKKIDTVNKELKSLGNTCQKKVISPTPIFRLLKSEFPLPFIAFTEVDLAPMDLNP